MACFIQLTIKIPFIKTYHFYPKCVCNGNALVYAGNKKAKEIMFSGKLVNNHNMEYKTVMISKIQ